MSVPVRVLLVEDTDVDARVMETVLHQYAFRVCRARRLGEALIALRSDEFDVILSDLGLPDSSGLATLEALRQHAIATPVVVITGRDDEQTALHAVAAGAQDYLVKGSTDANALVRAIRYAVGRRRASEELIENALDAVVTINLEGLIVRWNRSAEEIFNRPRAEVLGRPMAELIIPERLREAHHRAMRAFRDRGDASALGKRVEWVALRSDGSEFPVEVRITAEADGSGMMFTAFLSDITERRRAEEERIASEAKFRALVEHTYDIIYLCGADGAFTYVSPAVTRVLGYEPGELPGRQPLDFVHPDDAKSVASRFASSQEPAPLVAELRFRHRDGTWRHLEVVRANHLEDPAVRAIVGTARDVTGRRESQQALDQLRRRYELILNSIRDGVHGIDLSGNIIFENPAAAAILGWSMHHALGDGSECPIHWTPGAADDVFRRQDGVPVRVEYTSAPMVDEEGRISGAVVTFRDISRQKQMEEQIAHAARAASLGRVSASVAHEFNNLLMSVAPFTEVLRRKAQEDHSLEKPVRHIINAVRRGQRMTDEILRFTQPLQPRLERVDLASLIRDFADEARGVLLDREVELDVPPHLETRADPDQLTQVLLNLVVNARDATKCGGLVSIGAAPATELPFLREQLTNAEELVAFYVRDNGCGIPAEAREHIFEPFFTAGKRRGSGLGLAVAWRIAASHGGRILCESEEGAGTTFYVTCRS
jgi:PAS domain S-box-containing protein